MSETFITALVTQGGFAILAAVLIYLGWKDKKEAREDMKEARALFTRVIDMSANSTAAQVGLKDSVDGLKTEIVGLRAGIHDRVIPAISGIQLDMRELDGRVRNAEDGLRQQEQEQKRRQPARGVAVAAEKERG